MFLFLIQFSSAYLVDSLEVGKGNDSIVNNDSIVKYYTVIESVKNVEQVDRVRTVDNLLEPTLSVHGTEYVAGDNAKVWVQLLNESSIAVLDGICIVDIYNPDGSLLIYNAIMTNQNVDGIYYYDLTAPSIEGVYPVIAKCFYSSHHDVEYADDFSYGIGKNEDGTFLKTYALDGDEHKLSELKIDGISRLEFNYTFFDMCGLNVSENFLTGLTIIYNGKWNSANGDDITISILNHTNEKWINLSNKIIEPNIRDTVSNFLDTNNITRDGFVSPSGDLMLRFVDTNISDGTNNVIQNDLLTVSCIQTTPTFTDVMGSGEIHISSILSEFEVEFLFNDTSELIRAINTSTQIRFDEVELFVELSHNNSDIFIRAVNDSIISFVKSEFEFHNQTMFSRYNVLFSLIQNESFVIQNLISSEHLNTINNLTVRIDELESFIQAELDNLSINVSTNVTVNVNLDDTPIFEVNDTVNEILLQINSHNQSAYNWYLSLFQQMQDVNGSLITRIDSLEIIIDAQFDSLNQSLTSHVTGEHIITRDLIISAYLNLTSDVSGVSTQLSGVSTQISSLSSSISSLDSDLSTHDTDIKTLLSGIEDKIDHLELKLDLILVKLDIHLDSLNLEATTIDCLEGSVWSIEVVAFDSFENYLNDDDINCNITTDMWGVSPLVWNVDSFDYSHVCGYGNEIINWVVDCEEI